MTIIFRDSYNQELHITHITQEKKGLFDKIKKTHYIRLIRKTGSRHSGTLVGA